MGESSAAKLLRIGLTLVPVFSIFYTFYVLYYFLTLTGGYYPGKLPESGEELLRYYVNHPLMAVLNITIVSFGAIGIVFFSMIALTGNMRSQSIAIQLMNTSLILSGDYALKSVLAWSSY